MFRTQIKASILKENQERSPELMLWQAVIAQAITDATYNGLRKNYLECKRLAISWFSRYSSDFQATCNYADVDPKYAYQKFQKATKEGTFQITSQQDKILHYVNIFKPRKKYKKKFKLRF